MANLTQQQELQQKQQEQNQQQLQQNQQQQDKQQPPPSPPRQLKQLHLQPQPQQQQQQQQQRRKLKQQLQQQHQHQNEQQQQHQHQNHQQQHQNQQQQNKQQQQQNKQHQQQQEQQEQQKQQQQRQKLKQHHKKQQEQQQHPHENQQHQQNKEQQQKQQQQQHKKQQQQHQHQQQKNREHHHKQQHQQELKQRHRQQQQQQQQHQQQQKQQRQELPLPPPPLSPPQQQQQQKSPQLPHSLNAVVLLPDQEPPPSTSQAQPEVDHLSILLGVFQICLGVIMFSAYMAALYFYSFFIWMGHGVWATIFFLFTGGLGATTPLHGGNRRDRCYLHLFLGLCVWTALLAILVIAISFAAIVFDYHFYEERRGYHGHTVASYENHRDANFAPKPHYNLTMYANKSTAAYQNTWLPSEQDSGYGGGWNSTDDQTASDFIPEENRNQNDDHLYRTSTWQTDRYVALALNGVMLVVGVVETMVCLWSLLRVGKVVTCYCHCCRCRQRAPDDDDNTFNMADLGEQDQAMADDRRGSGALLVQSGHM